MAAEQMNSGDPVAEAQVRLADEMSTLPTVEELAGPLLRTIYALHNLNEVIWSAEFLDERRAKDEGATLVRLVEDVANLAEAAVNECTPGDGVKRGSELRRIIFDVADINGLRDQHHGYQAGVVARGGSA